MVVQATFCPAAILGVVNLPRPRLRASAATHDPNMGKRRFNQCGRADIYKSISYWRISVKNRLNLRFHSVNPLTVQAIFLFND